MPVHVAFTPDEAAPAAVGIVVDVLRATSTIAQALSAGYRRVLCCGELDEARALRSQVPDSLVGGERDAVRIEDFDVGASPREFLAAHAETLILSTTNGTRAIVTAAANCGTVFLGSLLNLSPVAAAAADGGADVTVLCAGFQGLFAIDDAYCAGRIVELVPGDRTDAAVASGVISASFASAWDGINARTYGPPGLEEDLRWCSQENTLEVVPRFSRMVGAAAEVVASDSA